MRLKTKQDDAIRLADINYIEIKMRLVSVSKNHNWLSCNNTIKRDLFIQVKTTLRQSNLNHFLCLGIIRAFRPLEMTLNILSWVEEVS